MLMNIGVKNLLETIVRDWPQVDTDEDMNGGDAVNALVFYVTRAKELLAQDAREGS